jgi:hypothetical protein
MENKGFIEFITYAPDYDETYLNELINKASGSWADVADADEWLHELRGGLNNSESYMTPQKPAENYHSDTLA